MRSAKGSRRNNQKIVPTTVCYCDGKRELGSVEVACTQCLKWFHGKCLKEYTDLQNIGVPFMICYTFTCKECKPTGEEWKPKKADLVQMCVTAFAILSADKLKEQDLLSIDIVPENHTYLSVKKTLVPYMDKHWEMLTSLKKKATWHLNVTSTLLKERNVFIQNDDDSDLFALVEKNLALLGPCHDAIKSIGKKSAQEKMKEVSLPKEEKVIELPPIEGPKTRGASKRRNAEGPAPGKKQKLADYSSTSIAGTQLDVPFCKDGYRYFVTEIDPNVIDESPRDNTTAYVIPSTQYRVMLNPKVAISSNDRAYQLHVETNTNNTWTVTGSDGYAMARATHGVAKGTWYFEVVFDEQPDDSHIRIGWAQGYAALQACVGYSKFSYGWRSKYGTKFHDAKGKSYYPGGFKEGDVLGCLIHLPVDSKTNVPNISSSKYLPPSHKGSTLINFKNNLFFEVHDEPAVVAKELEELSESRIEFFHNGKSCGNAYENIYAGYYYPSVSLFHKAKITVNFGPKLRYLPKNARPMCQRSEEQQHEQTLSDIIQLIAKDNDVEKTNPPEIKT